MIELPPIEPEEQQPAYDYQIALGSLTYRLVFRWRERTGSWYLSVYDSDDSALILNKRLVIDYPLLWRHTGRKPTGGYLILLDTDNAKQECGFQDLGHRCKLCWIPDSEWPEAPASDISITVS